MDITVTQIGEDWSILTKELIDQENLIKHLKSLGFQTTVNHETLYIMGAKGVFMVDVVQDFYKDRADVYPF